MITDQINEIIQEILLISIKGFNNNSKIKPLKPTTQAHIDMNIMGQRGMTVLNYQDEVTAENIRKNVITMPDAMRQIGMTVLNYRDERTSENIRQNVITMPDSDGPTSWTMYDPYKGHLQTKLGYDCRWHVDSMSEGLVKKWPIF